MAKPVQMGCMKCGGVVGLDINPGMERLDIKVKDGKIGRLDERSGTIPITCKKCGRPVATVAIIPGK